MHNDKRTTATKEIEEMKSLENAMRALVGYQIQNRRGYLLQVHTRSKSGPCITPRILINLKHFTEKLQQLAHIYTAHSGVFALQEH